MSAHRRPIPRTALVPLGALSAALAVADSASAQPAGSSARHVAAVLPSDGIGVGSAETIGDMRWAANLQLDYARNPVTVTFANGSGDAVTRSVVESQLRAHLVGSLTLANRAVVFVGLPIDLMVSGPSSSAGLGVPAASGANLGDAYLGGRVRLLGAPGDTFTLAAQASLSLPLAQLVERPTWSGDPSVGARIHLLPQLDFGMARLVFDVGANLRKSQAYPDSGIDSELAYGLGVTLRPVDELPLAVLAELRGAMSFAAFGDREQTYLEALAGVRYTLEENGLSFGAAGGAGLTAGIGSPDFRILGSLAWQGSTDSLDDDGDGVRNGSDACLDQPEDDDDFEDDDGCPDADDDRDGVADTADACRTVAEDADGFEDQDGCPDTDNDGDGVADADDAAPNEPEDADGFEDQDGRPELDNDGDGVADADDAAPNEPEDADGFEDQDGRPDPDNDGDEVLDARDRCPTEAGPVNNGGCPDRDRDGDTVIDRLDNCPDLAGTVANHGCADRQIIVIEEDGQIEILARVHFETGSATLERPSFEVLDTLAAVIMVHPEIPRIRIEGHTDETGTAQTNEQLSLARAEAVRDYLIAHGVEPERLRCEGHGSRRPRVAQGRGRRTLEQNRRVEFFIEPF